MLGDAREPLARRKAWVGALAAGRRPDGFTLLLVAAAVLGAGLVLLRQASYGPGMQADGLGYIMAARNLLAGDGFHAYWGRWVYHPPLYPAMLAGGGTVWARPARFRRAAQRRLLRADRSGRGSVAAAPFALPVPVALGLLLDRACPSARRSGVPRPERVGFHSVRDARADADQRPLGRRRTRGPDPGGGVQRAGVPDPLHGRFRGPGGGPAAARGPGRAAGEDETHRSLYADRGDAVGSVDAAEPPGWRVHDRRKRPGFLLVGLHRGRGLAKRPRGLVARRVDGPGPVGAGDGRRPCAPSPLGREKGRSPLSRMLPGGRCACSAALRSPT